MRENLIRARQALNAALVLEGMKFAIVNGELKATSEVNYQFNTIFDTPELVGELNEAIKPVLERWIIKCKSESIKELNGKS